MRLGVKWFLTRAEYIDGKGWCFYENGTVPYLALASEDIYSLSELDRNVIYLIVHKPNGSSKFVPHKRKEGR